MSKAHGLNRNFKHYFILTILFTLVAGIINAYGVIQLGTFTTNLTGHVGTMALNIREENALRVTEISIWIITFLTGAFISSSLINLIDSRDPKLSHLTPVLLEIILLSSFMIFYDDFPTDELIDIRVLLLLMAMGIQNGIVSFISGNVVRTTHITGMVTDIGLGLGDLFSGRRRDTRTKQKVIISILVVICFLSGAVFSAYYYRSTKHFLLIPIGLLVIIIIYDYFTLLQKSKKPGNKFRA